MRVLLLILFLSPIFLYSQTKISGFVYDKNNGEALVGANIIFGNRGTSTNGYGYFSFITTEEKFFVSYVGYKTERFEADSLKNNVINVYLKTSGMLNEVVLYESSNEGNRTALSSINLKSKTISQLPVLLGEADIFKSLQLLPGVGMGEDGSSDFYVRGGSSDQNLILIDDVPIYTATHSAGYFSAVNNEVIRDVKLYKGAFPSRYGGRVSSVLDIRTREGNTQKINSSISISPFILQANFETPIIKGKSALLIGYRHSFYDMLLGLGVPANVPMYGFEDINIKYHHHLGGRDKIFIAFYKGKDRFYQKMDAEDYAEKTYDGYMELSNKYGNSIVSLRWNHVFKNNMFANTTLSYNNYEYIYINESEISTGGVKEFARTKLGNYSHNFRVKTDFSYSLNSINKLEFGWELSKQNYTPVYSLELNNDTVTYENSSTEGLIVYNDVYRVYIEDKMNFGKLNINVGFSGALFDTGNENYYSFEPRVSLNYEILKNLKISTSYSSMSQNMHLITQTGPVLPEDVWLPSTDSLPPVFANQATLGFNYKIGKFNFSAEAFYKLMKNVTEKRFDSNGRSPIEAVSYGLGYSYGIENMLTIELDKVMLNLNYTYSRSFRDFEDLNYGQVFPFRYDRPHDLKFFTIWNVSKKWNLSTVLTWKSGANTTVLQAVAPAEFTFGDEYTYSYYAYYGFRNSYRLPNYFRWDIDASYSYKGDWGNYVLKFGFYNVTNHFNAQELKINRTGFYAKNTLNIMPYFSYSWRLN